MNLFWDIPFECDYPLIGWQFFARSPGEFFVSIWRPDAPKTNMELIAKFQIDAPTEGPTVSMNSILHQMHIEKLSSQSSVLLPSGYSKWRSALSKAGCLSPVDSFPGLVCCLRLAQWCNHLSPGGHPWRPTACQAILGLYNEQFSVLSPVDIPGQTAGRCY